MPNVLLEVKFVWYRYLNKSFRKEESTGKGLLSLSPQVVKVLLEVDYS